MRGCSRIHPSMGSGAIRRPGKIRSTTRSRWRRSAACCRPIEMITSGHIHIFEALTFGRTNPQWPPQLVVGTGGDKLAKKPNEPDNVLGVQVDHSLIVKNFAYMILDRDGADW